MGYVEQMCQRTTTSHYWSLPDGEERRFGCQSVHSRTVSDAWQVVGLPACSGLDASSACALLPQWALLTPAVMLGCWGARQLSLLGTMLTQSVVGTGDVADVPQALRKLAIWSERDGHRVPKWYCGEESCRCALSPEWEQSLGIEGCSLE